MAEALFGKVVKKKGLKAQAHSAGISAIDGLGATEETIGVLKEKDIDVSGHRSRRVDQKMIIQADIIFVFEELQKRYLLETFPEAEGKLYLLTEFYEGKGQGTLELGIPDPIKMNREFYGNVMKIIRRSVESIVRGLAGGT